MIRAAEAQRAAQAQELDRLRDEEKKTRVALDTVHDEHESAWENLIGQLVPELSADALNRAAQLVHLPEIDVYRTHDRMQKEQEKLRALIQETEANPDWSNRAAHDNEAQIRLAEVNDALVPLQAGINELEEEPAFLDCIHAGYGTASYAGRFWQLSYYRLWKHGDLVVEKYGPRFGITDFAGVRQRYERDQGAVTALVAERDRWQTRQKALRLLGTTHEKATADLGSLGPRQLAWVRGRLRTHLSSLSAGERAQLSGQDESLRIAHARVAGTEAKRDYLEQLRSEMIGPAIADLTAGLAKIDRDLGKLRRPKNAARRFSDDEYQRRFGKDRHFGWQKRRTRIHDARTCVIQFHHYDRWSYSNDLLWWDVMADGRLDGNFIREVRERGPRDEHGRDEHWRHDHAAVASASAGRDDLARDIS
jgi:hypothetical protein